MLNQKHTRLRSRVVRQAMLFASVFVLLVGGFCLVKDYRERKEASGVGQPRMTYVEIDSYHFPDEALRSYLHSYVDTNGDWALDGQELMVDTLSMAHQYISDLSGLYYLTNVIAIQAPANPIKKLSADDLPYGLQRLDLYGSELTELDLSSTNITHLNVANSKLQKLILPKGATLNTLNASHNNLSSIDLSSATLAIDIDLSHNALSQVNIQNNTSTRYLNLANNNISALDLSNQKDLTNLDLSNNQLTSINLQNNTNLSQLALDNNHLAALDLSSNSALFSASFTGNVINFDNRKIPLKQFPSGFDRNRVSNIKNAKLDSYYFEVTSNSTNQFSYSYDTKNPSFSPLEVVANVPKHVAYAPPSITLDFQDPNATYTDGQEVPLDLAITNHNSNQIELWFSDEPKATFLVNGQVNSDRHFYVEADSTLHVTVSVWVPQLDPNAPKPSSPKLRYTLNLTNVVMPSDPNYTVAPMDPFVVDIPYGGGSLKESDY